MDRTAVLALLRWCCCAGTAVLALPAGADAACWLTLMLCGAAQLEADSSTRHFSRGLRELVAACLQARLAVPRPPPCLNPALHCAAVVRSCFCGAQSGLLLAERPQQAAQCG